MTRPDEGTVRRATVAGAIGSFVEWYDYGIYGLLVTYLAVNLAGGAEAGSLFLANVGFLVSFVARPFGGLICGYLGDRLGRRTLLAILLLLISTSTAAIGLLPSTETIGIAAPILLLALRVLQGFSAGGEVAGAMSFVGEYAPDGERNFRMSFVAVGSFVALMFGSAFSAFLIVVLGDETMTSWAWRVPFLLAVPLGYIGFYIRRRLEETPVFQAAREQNTTLTNPLREAFTSRRHLLAILLTVFLPALNGPGYYLLFTYMPTYLKTSLGDGVNFTMLQALLVTAISLVAIIICIPLAARVSDRLGRKPVLYASAIASGVLAYPMFLLIASGQFVLAAIGATVMAIAFSGHAATIHTVLAEMFPTSVRYSAYSIGFSISTIIFGGSAPLVMTALIGSTGSNLIPAYAAIVAALITLVALSFVRETKGRPLEVS
ncbi:MFS transporter [Pseudonocardia phyllosphaerae]|uniref:MFS transporter n=1 Tax=Pseudonocardia phyllosphaerae TaxID=3390502 RepID=UPI00397AA55E